MTYVQTIAIAAVSWLVVLVALARVAAFRGPAFTALHWALDVIVFGLAYWLFYKFGSAPSPFIAMAISMATMFVLEVGAWGLLYKGDLWFLNFWDWIVPVFLVASTIYWVGRWVG